jgi:hypothetical protein
VTNRAKYKFLKLFILRALFHGSYCYICMRSTEMNLKMYFVNDPWQQKLKENSKWLAISSLT